MKRYTAFGLTIASSRPLPGLGRPSQGGRADIRLHTGTAPWSHEVDDDPGRVNVWFLTQMYARFWNDLADHASA